MSARTEQRLKRVEDAISMIGDVAKKFEGFASRVTALEESRQNSAGLIARAFTRLESVETALKGDGTDANPGMYATQLVVKKDVEAVQKNLAANTWWTRSIALAIVLGILAWAGNTLLETTRVAATHQGP